MKLNITLNLSKIDKSKIVDRSYQTKEGETVIEKQYKIEVIELKQPKFVAEGDTWKMLKTHFVVEAQTKEERDAKKESVYVGEGFTFESKESFNQQADALEGVDVPF